jgi:hypothetical protein
VQRLRSAQGWLGPTFLGAIAGFLVVTVLFRLGWSDEPLATELLRAVALGAGLGLAFVVVDVVLAARHVRAIPEGKLAAGSALAGGFLGEILWILPSWEPIPALPILVLKLLVTATTVRLIFSRTR